ncbi:Uu.00g135920.m01.CDS01 [Anthostomella pinea]|uniref:Uu.00g135920.m01.CDS01 n=1 Tax=Anthostomella pinea TaxID=933095 RepID=A0AAI8YKX9_9PEZI|nr:Uu.00g135920.m01.CDS01 [Anthostomella pinea]
MSSPLKKQPEAVADKVLKRVEVSKIARRLQGRLALAHLKTKHGWEDLTLDTLEPKVEEERRRRICDGDAFSDSSSSTSELPYPSRALMSSPLKAPLFSDAIGSSNGSTGHRKRTYTPSFDMTMSSPPKRLRSSPTAHKSFNASHSSWRGHRQLIQSSPIKPRRQQHFTTSNGPEVSFFQGTRRPSVDLTSPNFAAQSDDDDDLLPAHSFQVDHNRASPPSTPPMRSRGGINGRNHDKGQAKTYKAGEEGADLLLYLAHSPSPAKPSSNRTLMEPPSTPPPRKDLALPSSMMTTPGGGGMFPTTPGQAFDFADFVNITPSPAQRPWKTPLSISARTPTAKTPTTGARRRLTFDEPMPHGLA